MNKPKAVAVTLREGGDWTPFPCKHLMRHFYPTNILVHSIKFEDGSVWDALNGWRPAMPLSYAPEPTCLGTPSAQCVKCSHDPSGSRVRHVCNSTRVLPVEPRYTATPWGLFEPSTGVYKAT